MDRPTYLHTRSSCTFEALEVRLRGQETTAGVYLAAVELPLRKTRGIPGLQVGLIGRGAELAVLEQAAGGLVRGVGSFCCSAARRASASRAWWPRPAPGSRRERAGSRGAAWR